MLPLNGGSFGLWFQILGRPASREDERPLAEFFLASPGYFETLGIPVLAGRAFTDEDRPDVGRVAIVSASLAHHRWPGVSPVGARIQLPFLPDTVTVVGVAGDVLTRALDASYAEGLTLPPT